MCLPTFIVMEAVVVYLHTQRKVYGLRLILIESKRFVRMPTLQPEFATVKNFMLWSGMVCELCELRKMWKTRFNTFTNYVGFDRMHNILFWWVLSIRGTGTWVTYSICPIKVQGYSCPVRWQPKLSTVAWLSFLLKAGSATCVVHQEWVPCCSAIGEVHTETWLSSYATSKWDTRHSMQTTMEWNPLLQSPQHILFHPDLQLNFWQRTLWEVDNLQKNGQAPCPWLLLPLNSKYIKPLRDRHF